MPNYEPTAPFQHGTAAATGVLVVNLGTPEAPTTPAVRRFLRQFLWDPRVVEYPRLLWWLILNLVILVIRPPRSAAAYREIWTDEGSPLMIYSKKIVAGLDSRLEDVELELAMTYGDPAIDDAIDRLVAKGVRRILVLPLYPQYSGTTTASVFDAVTRKLGRMRWIPEIRFIGSYHDDPGYIDALANSVREYRATHQGGDKLLMSFHGVPKYTLDGGDPYFCHCQKTARLLATALQLEDHEWNISFQSRVGREEWLQPYTEETVRGYGGAGMRRLDVMCPGFSADCLETLEEIAMQNAEAFSEAGGGELHYIPALNDRDDHLDALANVITRHLAGWSDGTDVDAEQSAKRARALGASA
ncbi:MAG: ferrochelatase [Pseudomonadota bacterium]